VSRRNQLLLVAAALVWGAALALLQPWRGGAHERTSAAVRPLFPDLPDRLEEVVRIEVRGPDGGLTHLSARGGRWWVDEREHPADPLRLVQLTESLQNLETRDPVSVNPENFSVYDVGPGQGTRVTLLDAEGGVVADWILGKLRSQEVESGAVPVLEFYMRRADGDEVYLSGDAIQPPTDPADWLDTRFLAAVEDDDVDWVERQDLVGGESWRIERGAGDDEPKWWLAAPPPRRPAWDFAGDSLVYTLIGLRAVDVAQRLDPDAEPPESMGFTRDRFRVGVGDDVLTLELGGSDGAGHRYLRVGRLPWVYLLDDFTVDQLRQATADMLPPPDDGDAPDLEAPSASDGGGPGAIEDHGEGER